MVAERPSHPIAERPSHPIAERPSHPLSVAVLMLGGGVVVVERSGCFGRLSVKN